MYHKYTMLYQPLITVTFAVVEFDSPSESVTVSLKGTIFFFLAIFPKEVFIFNLPI